MSARGIEIACWATVVRDGEQKTSAAGNSYGVVLLSADSGHTDENGKPVPAFMRVFGFGPLASITANLRKGGKAYLEGVLSCGIWQPDSGPAKLDLSVRAAKLEPTQIGKKRPPRDTVTNYQAPIEPARQQQHDFDDAIPF